MHKTARMRMSLKSFLLINFFSTFIIHNNDVIMMKIQNSSKKGNIRIDLISGLVVFRGIKRAQNGNEETKRNKHCAVQIKWTAKLNEVNKGCQLRTIGLEKLEDEGRRFGCSNGLFKWEWQINWRIPWERARGQSIAIGGRGSGVSNANFSLCLCLGVWVLRDS